MKILLKHTICDKLVQFEDTQSIEVSKIDKQNIKCPNCKGALKSKDLK
jgi:tRNA(Ile2) C34 agmatinyltransferase TiaS